MEDLRQEEVDGGDGVDIINTGTGANTITSNLDAVTLMGDNQVFDFKSNFTIDTSGGFVTADVFYSDAANLATFTLTSAPIITVTGDGYVLSGADYDIALHGLPTGLSEGFVDGDLDGKVDDFTWVQLTGPNSGNTETVLDVLIF